MSERVIDRVMGDEVELMAAVVCWKAATLWLVVLAIKTNIGRAILSILMVNRGACT